MEATEVTQELARVVYYPKSVTPPQLDPFHVMQRKIAEFYLTESVFPPGFHVPRHSHQYHCIYLVLEGSFSETQGRKDRRRERFDVVLTPIDQPHADTFHDSGGRCFFVEIPSGWAERVRDYSTILESNIELQSKSLSWLMMRLYREALNLDSVSPLVIEGGLLEIIAAASRLSFRETARTPPAWLKTASEMLREQFAEHLTLSEMAKSVGVHPAYLATAFRKYYACSVGGYIRRLRIEYASKEIASSDEPITNIALRAGFADHSHLSKTFKRLTGLTPSQHRSLARRS